MDQLGQVINRGMQRRGIPNYARLAERVGVSGATVSRWVNGKGIPERDAMVRLSEILGEPLPVLEEAAGVLPAPTHSVETLHPSLIELHEFLTGDELTDRQKERLEREIEDVLDLYRRAQGRREVLAKRLAGRRIAGTGTE